MRNDARPIGQEFRDIADPDHDDRKPGDTEGVRRHDDNTPFVVNREPEDEAPPDASDR